MYGTDTFGFEVFFLLQYRYNSHLYRPFPEKFTKRILEVSTVVVLGELQTERRKRDPAMKTFNPSANSAARRAKSDTQYSWIRALRDPRRFLKDAERKHSKYCVLGMRAVRLLLVC